MGYFLFPMDQTEATVKNLKQIAKEVMEGMKKRTDEFKKSLVKFKEINSRKMASSASDRAKLMSAHDDQVFLDQALNSTLLSTRNAIEKEEYDIQKLENEQASLLRHVNELENSNRNLLEKIIDTEDKESQLQNKIKQLKDKKDNKMKDQKEHNDLFKLYLGLDIQKLKENTIKIIFNNMGTECYVVMDFSLTDPVCECLPELNLEKANYSFKEEENFYTFVKYIRTQLKQNM